MQLVTAAKQRIEHLAPDELAAVPAEKAS